VRLNNPALVLFTMALALAPLTAAALGPKNTANAAADPVVTITQMENDNVKADLAGDASFVTKNYATNFTGGTSFGNWETKQSILADMNDGKSKTNSEQISELNVRVYGFAAVATYKSTYDMTYKGEHRSRTILSTDTFIMQDGTWRLVASHSSEAAK
jgi:hypothetical protein